MQKTLDYDMPKIVGAMNLVKGAWLERKQLVDEEKRNGFLFATTGRRTKVLREKWERMKMKEIEKARDRMVLFLQVVEIGRHIITLPF